MFMVPLNPEPVPTSHVSLYAVRKLALPAASVEVHSYKPEE